MKSKRRKPKPEIIGLIGVGLDGADGHTRVTRAEDVLLVGGSEETHERMQDTIIHVSEAVEKDGKRIRDLTVEEMIDLVHKAQQ